MSTIEETSQRVFKQVQAFLRAHKELEKEGGPDDPVFAKIQTGDFGPQDIPKGWKCPPGFYDKLKTWGEFHRWATSANTGHADTNAITSVGTGCYGIPRAIEAGDADAVKKYIKYIAKHDGILQEHLVPAIAALKQELADRQYEDEEERGKGTRMVGLLGEADKALHAMHACVEELQDPQAIFFATSGKAEITRS